jgi:hypothetical protein
MRKRKPIMRMCQMCERQYDVNETIRVFGDMNWVNKFCTAQCMTKKVLEGFDEKKNSNG